MLIQFNFENYKAFKGRASLDMTATRITEHADHIRSVGNERLLPAAAIFGANASGKTCVCQAFAFMARYVLNSLQFGGEGVLGDEPPRHSTISNLKRSPFLFDRASHNKNSLFEVYFVDALNSKQQIINYGFCLGKDGVEEEWLNTKAKTSKDYKRVFYRSYADGMDLSGLDKQSRSNIEAGVEDETLVLSLGARINKIDILKRVSSWFGRNRIVNFGDGLKEWILPKALPPDFADDKAAHEDIVRYLNAFDSAIVDIDVQRIPSLQDGDDNPRYDIAAVHRIAGSKAKTKLRFDEESAGTQKMFALYHFIKHVINRGSVLMIDELNSKLHPLLQRIVIQTFLDPERNPKNAQLIFTTHDSYQMSNDLFRRDEIWFTEKDADGAATLYSLADFIDEDGDKIRKDESYQKNYLLGKYGAIPTLKGLSFGQSERAS